MNAFLQALTFMTRIPVRFQMKPAEWSNSAPFYPLVGLVIGCFLYLLAQFAFFLLPPFPAAIIAVAGWVWITGGLHLDGLMDTADGIGSSRSRERMLEIMKDSRAGAMGVMACVLLLLLKVGLVHALFATGTGATLAVCLLLPPVLARTGILLSMSFWPYVHGAGQGLASSLITGLTPKKRNLALTLSLLFVVFAAGPVLGLLFILSCGVFTLLFNRSLTEKLGGLSGDTYGALAESSEALLLLVGVSYVHLGGTAGWLHLFG